jgi:hypothetical protein
VRPYYELHITYLGEEAAEIDGWKPSTIDGDIILGEGPKRYLTHHSSGTTPQVVLIKDMERVADDLRASGRRVLRTKIELVVYDQRTP